MAYFASHHSGRLLLPTQDAYTAEHLEGAMDFKRFTLSTQAGWRITSWAYSKQTLE